MKHIILAILLVIPSLCVLGLDVTNPITSSNFQCLKNNGANFVVVDAWTGNGSINGNANSNLRNARQTNLPTDIYMQPCASMDPTSQVNQLLSSIPPSLYTRVWIDVAYNNVSSCAWGTNYTSNC